jgi:hypothetical protein
MSGYKKSISSLTGINNNLWGTIKLFNTRQNSSISYLHYIIIIIYYY